MAVEVDELILSDNTEVDESLSVRKLFACSEEKAVSKVAAKLPLVSTLSGYVSGTEDNVTLKQEINDAKMVAELHLCHNLLLKVIQRIECH